MPSTISRRYFSPDTTSHPFALPDANMKDASPLLNFDDANHFDAPSSEGEQMIFGPLDLEEGAHYNPPAPFPWDPFTEFDSPASNTSQFSSLSPSSPSHFDYNVSQIHRNDSIYDPGTFPGQAEPQQTFTHDVEDSEFYLSNWLNEPEPSSMHVSSSLPIPIRPHTSDIQTSSSFVPLSDRQHFPQETAFSPTSFAALHSLPRSISPSMTVGDFDSFQTHQFDSISPHDTSLHTPSWASQLWNSSSYVPTLMSPRSHHTPTSESSRRQRLMVRRDSIPGNMFQSSSAPSAIHTRPMGLTRSYSRRAESSSVADDHDATIRRKKRIPTQEESRPAERTIESPPSKSLLRPPKLAPSAWQLYFTDWIQRQQASNTRKLNVAQAAKEAGQEYACLSSEEKEPYKRRSQFAKEARERELAAYMKTLTPDDIKRENTFRAAQRKAGKSRKSNIKDPNAPKKPLSAYFMFLQRIRSDPMLVQEVFGDETETTKQSVLAAAKWRSMTDDERKPFLARAEQEKLDYEAARRMYEEGTVGFGSSINFSILPGSPAETAFRASRAIKPEPMSSESEGEEFMTDDGMGIRF